MFLDLHRELVFGFRFVWSSVKLLGQISSTLSCSCHLYSPLSRTKLSRMESAVNRFILSSKEQFLQLNMTDFTWFYAFLVWKKQCITTHCFSPHDSAKGGYDIQQDNGNPMTLNIVRESRKPRSLLRASSSDLACFSLTFTQDWAFHTVCVLYSVHYRTGGLRK